MCECLESIAVIWLIVWVKLSVLILSPWVPFPGTMCAQLGKALLTIPEARATAGAVKCIPALSIDMVTRTLLLLSSPPSLVMAPCGMTMLGTFVVLLGRGVLTCVSSRLLAVM